MALTKGDSPLLWRGARGEADDVNIPNANTKNINTPTIEIVGFDMTGTSTSHLALASAQIGPSRTSHIAHRPSPFAPQLFNGVQICIYNHIWCFDCRDQN